MTMSRSLGPFGYFVRRAAAFAAVLVFGLTAKAQISPGPLAKPHANLGAATQCAKCHAIGASGTFKCLECHTDIARRIAAHTGLHAAEPAEKCVRCHSDHNGPDFPLIVFDPKTFDHRKQAIRSKESTPGWTANVATRRNSSVPPSRPVW